MRSRAELVTKYRTTVVPPLPAGDCFGLSPWPAAGMGPEPTAERGHSAHSDTSTTLHIRLRACRSLRQILDNTNNGPHAAMGVDVENNGHGIYTKCCMGYPRRPLTDVKNKIKTQRQNNKKSKDCAPSITFMNTRPGHLTAEC